MRGFGFGPCDLKDHGVPPANRFRVPNVHQGQVAVKQRVDVMTLLVGGNGPARSRR